MKLSSGVEVGHIFKLGDKYSSKMNANFLDSKGRSRPFIMGCYGFGISRTAAAVIEQHHDDAGIVWPKSIAPFQILILPINVSDGEVMKTAVAFERELEEKGVEVLIDDRDLSPGVKFKDSELIGIPLRLTIGKKLEAGKVELFDRATKKVDEISAGDALEKILERL
jgi:prolyl-tRNA synthetase